jgi:transcriptional regulator with PAS, ATPase and Fis domain
MGKPLTLREIEHLAILDALDRNNGNKLAAARELGIGKTTLYRRLNEKRETQAAPETERSIEP